jgi:hypothetical protein
MRRAFAILVLAGLLLAITASPALAFHHVAVPADECATNAAVTPGNNPTARRAIMEHNPAQTLPLPPFGTPSQAPTTCPAPQK